MSQVYRIKNKLKLYRKTTGMTQNQVANYLDLHSLTPLSRWERGESLPDLTRALRLSALYKRLVNDIFFDLYQEQIMALSRLKSKNNRK